MLLFKVAEALNVTIVPSDIEICHKLKRSKGPQPILVKFFSHQTKSKLYRERTKLKIVKISDIYPSYSSSGDRRIFILENLTTYRRELVAEANRRRRDGTLLSIWILDGKIYVKTSPEGTPKKIIILRISITSRPIKSAYKKLAGRAFELEVSKAHLYLFIFLFAFYLP